MNNHAASRGVLVVRATGNDANASDGLGRQHSWPIRVVAYLTDGRATSQTHVGKSLGCQGVGGPGWETLGLDLALRLPETPGDERRDSLRIRRTRVALVGVPRALSGEHPPTRGEHCVAEDDPNARQGCCPADQIVCAGSCCAKGEVCCADECHDPATGTCTASGWCASPSHVCPDGTCCPPFSQCDGHGGCLHTPTAAPTSAAGALPTGMAGMRFALLPPWSPVLRRRRRRHSLHDQLPALSEEPHVL